MPRRKPLAALAALIVALALAVTAVSASAAPTSQSVRKPLAARLAPGSLACQFLVNQIRFATLTHNVFLESAFGQVFVYSGCGGAAI